MYKPKKAPVILTALAVMLLFSVSCGVLETIMGGKDAVSANTPDVQAAETPLPSVTGNAPADTPPGYVTYSSQGWLLSSWSMSQLEIKPAAPKAGEAVEVWANIYIPDIPMSFIRAELMVNGVPAGSKQLTFWWDDPQDFCLTFTPAQPGEYDVVVRASMIENDSYVKSSGVDLSLYSSLKVNVSS